MSVEIMDAPKNMDEPKAVLKRLFGYGSFRPNQEEIIQAILAGQDAFVVMPTGGGKSLCYQLPASMLDGTCLVVSPLISLMKDQVDAARETGIRAAYLNSSLDGAEQSRVLRDLVMNELDLLYVSPERFAMPDFLATLGQVRLSFVAIDEAHCISDWGHDFRPDYLSLSEIVERFPSVPVAAFTATATARVQQDIITRLGLRNPHVVRASFNRPNLFYRVVAKAAPAKQILAFVKEHADEPGIIYRTTRKDVEATAQDLVSNGINAVPYHAGLTAEVRTANQEAFNRDEVDVVVATIAFGMGIDKSNVRFVLHADLPKTIEGYYQETGRAGRDGEPAVCQLLFGRGDIPRLRFFIDKIEDQGERKRALTCLYDVEGYASLNVCRRKQLLQYFGEAYHEEPCSGCDVCMGEVEQVDATREAQIMLSAIARTGQRYGISYIVDVVIGADTARIRNLGHDQIKTYGAGRENDKQFWRGVMSNLLAQEVVRQTDDQYPVIKLGRKAEDILYRQASFSMLRQVARKAVARQSKFLDSDCNPDLFAELRVLRKTLAKQQGVPPFVVFSDRTLREMAGQMPTDEEAMLNITGIGAVKFERYGQAFIQQIKTFLETSSSKESPLFDQEGDAILNT